MPPPFPAEFRLRAVALVRAGKPITTSAVQLGVSAADPSLIERVLATRGIDRGMRSAIETGISPYTESRAYPYVLPLR